MFRLIAVEDDPARDSPDRLDPNLWGRGSVGLRLGMLAMGLV
jgi:hypothetical protein